MSREWKKRIEETLAQFLKPMKGIPFDVVIKSLRRASVEKFDPSNEYNKEALLRLKFEVRHRQPRLHRMLRWTDTASTWMPRNVA